MHTHDRLKQVRTNCYIHLIPFHKIMPKKYEAIENYILAKDGNRPFLLEHAFTDNAALKVITQTDAIKFPTTLTGRQAIADTMVSNFNQQFENIYTICIDERPQISNNEYHCHWLVVMTEKQTMSLRTGWGRYEWKYDSQDNRVQSLDITIVDMQTSSSSAETPAVLLWVSKLPYPWCSLSNIITDAPKQHLGIDNFIRYLSETTE